MIAKSEIRTRQYLKKRGYWFVRAGGSFGLWDFIATNDKEILFIQAKCNQGPRREELGQLVAFKNHPNIRQIKKQIWIWKKFQREPIIKEVTDELLRAPQQVQIERLLRLATS